MVRPRMLGIVPLNWLSSRNRYSRLERRLRSGISPLNWFW